MARATIILEDRDDGEGIDFQMRVEPEPLPDVPATRVQAVAFDIAHRLQQMERDSFDDDDPTDIDEPTDVWEPT